MPLADTLNRKPGDILKSDDWNVIIKEIDRKINRDGADTLKGPLTIDEALNANSNVTIKGILSIVVPQRQDSDGQILVLGPDLRLGYDQDYYWIQSGLGKPLLINRLGNNIGIGSTINPVAKLDIASATRTGTHPTAVKGLYITGDFNSDNDGVEFRHSNGTQGIGFGSNTIYAAGSNANQDLGLKAKGTGEVKVYGKLSVTSDLIVTGKVNVNGRDISDDGRKLDNHINPNVTTNPHKTTAADVGALSTTGGTVTGNLKVNGAITPSVGNDEKKGIMFPTNPGGGGDAAWIRYYVRDGREATTFEIGTSNDEDDHIALMPNAGNVGIGTNNPTKAKVQIERYQYYQQPEGYAYLVKKTGVQITGYGSDKAAYSLYASNRIIASEINAFSDERIKEIYNRSDSQEDLKTLLQIEVTDYSYRDKIAKGNGKQKKVIGQQIAKVFPQAVSTNTDVVCDIFQFATLSDGWVTLTNHGLKTGERVKLIWGEDKSEIFTIEAVTPDTFQIDLDYCGDILVYGREVNDFHVVDYDALSMLHISATQELYKIIKKLEEKINEKVKG